MTESSIDINDILFKATMNNSTGFISIIPLFIGYYLQDTVFTRSVAEVTSNLPKFVEDVTFNKVLAVLLPYIIALILFYVSSVISAHTIPRIELEALHALTDKLIESIKTSKKAININELMLHIKKISDTKNIYKIIISYIVPTAIVALSLIYNFLKGDQTTGLMIIIIITMLMMVTIKVEYASINDAYHAEESINTLYDEIHEIMSNVDTVITCDTKQKELDNIDKVKDTTFDVCHQSAITNVNVTYGLQVLSIVSMLGINYLSYDLYKKSVIDAPTMISTVLLSLLFMDYYDYCIIAIMELITNIGRLYDSSKYFSTFKIVLEEPDQKKRHPGTENSEEFAGLAGIRDNGLIDLNVRSGDIKFQDITLRHGNALVFNKFNLDIEGGTKVGLVGPIGSGKTTLLKMLARIINYQGRILIDGQDLKYCTYTSSARHIAYISQQPKLFNKSILYNLNYGSDLTDREIRMKLRDLGLLAFFNSFPDGLDTVVGKEGGNISGGQRQFVALIRAIIQNKSIILLDEPSSSLDQKNKRIFMGLIKNIKNKTIIVSTHDKQLLSLFDKTVDIQATKSKSSRPGPPIPVVRARRV